MSDPARPDDSAPPTIRIGWGAVIFIVLSATVWLFGVNEFDALLAIDTQCDNERYYGRGAELAEILRCSLEAGPRGWFYIAWLASFPFLTVTWLERKLRKAMLARRNVTPRD